MSLSFACPQCRAQIEVGDELAGQMGQCPRCQHVFTIPAPTQPMPIAVGRAIPVESSVPPTDPWAKETPRDEAKRRPRWDDRPRPKRVRTAPPQPSGPLWPWFVGVLGALVVGGLLFSSFLVLVVWRKPVTNPPMVGIAPPPLEFINIDLRVTAGRFDGQRAFLNGGVFQIKTELNNNDPRDLRDQECRLKRFEVELIAFRTYVIEQDSNQFDCLVGVEEPNGNLRESGNPGVRNARLVFAPQQTQIYVIQTTSVNPGTGPFTLTVREQGRPKPFVP